MNKNILVICSQGFIVSVLTNYLLKEKYQIIGVDNFIYSQKKINFYSKNYKLYKNINNKKFENYLIKKFY